MPLERLDLDGDVNYTRDERERSADDMLGQGKGIIGDVHDLWISTFVFILESVRNFQFLCANHSR